jgi:TetR/AcrR family transcriptional regulator of autoinduction and epiphytic fitness
VATVARRSPTRRSPADDLAVDGRAARANRTRLAVVDALLQLIDEGDLRPTAPRIAEQAGVSLRSIFQHFSDLEALFAVATERELERLSALVGPLPTGASLGDRLDAFVAQRARVLEAVTPVSRASLLQESSSAELRSSRMRLLALARAEVAGVFGAELDRRPRADRIDLLDALDAVSSWQTWEALRAHQGLSPTRARRVMRRMLSALLEERN